MRTEFSNTALADPKIASSNAILRKCVHCGFCTATCPTYQLLGDERDSPRGRIYLIKQMLEEGRPADAETVTHIDRCLSCLSCMTTCPSGVHYMHLVDHARDHIEKTYKRPLMDRLVRKMLATVLPNPLLFRLSLIAANIARPVAGLMPQRLRPMLAMAPKELPGGANISKPGNHAAKGEKKKRVALLAGCAQTVLDPEINAATIRLLTRHGVETVIAEGAGCCGSLTHHLGMEEPAHSSAAANIRAWIAEMDGAGLDAILVNTSGCGTTVKDYGFMFRNDPELAEPAKRVSAIAKDISEFLPDLDLQPPDLPSNMRVTYHSACSLQHGQKVKAQPVDLLKKLGFEVSQPAEGHLCCGSAGTYNLLQPEIASRLRDRKVGNIARTQPEVIAAGNIGCITQIASGTGTPVLHTVQLIDWATGGPLPPALAASRRAAE